MLNIRKHWVPLAVCIIAIFILVIVFARTRYPPFFIKKRTVRILSVFNTDCGVTDILPKVANRNDSEGLRCDLYLVSDQDLGKPRFEGQGLNHEYNQIRDGDDVEGNGQVLWSRNIIEIKAHSIRINGKPIKPGVTSVTIESDGSFQEDRRATAY
jgi:hypothetical protein